MAFRGPLNDAIYEAGTHPILKAALKIENAKSAAFQQMQDAEYVLRFLTLHSDWQDFTGSLVKSMDSFMLDNRSASVDAANGLVSPFSVAIDRTGQLWGDVAFQRWDGQRWRQQALAGLFDAEMIAAIMLQEDQIRTVSAKSDVLVEKTKELFSDDEFEEAVRTGTNTPARLKYRVERMYELLIELA